ncbi:GMC family oxidoreductase N-terminal domain-containing protein [Steroidobacter sp. S1-65]|uniref:GMC family oxidoreductase N-terminal domain-containing protein n=1 Tax=Steroidobacter gossypii TaxID=2805490 RepID=A0ABS1WR15_9GAMM|nr:GMC family oxidoreductase N-terminal domain-containing protein [Steroidobacter gossypii]MBM0103408.1 GMC family oxidoreductase N-terminal domain-containing protein [Steroidobacter gossypii]
MNPPAEILEADYVIAGGGSAGCVLTRRLIDAGHSVILLEAGGDDRSAAVYVPAGSARLVGNAMYDWKYETEPDPSRNGRIDSWPSGKVLGGGSSINGMIYLRGIPADYQRWVEQGAKGWSFPEVLPYFLRAERNENGASEFHSDQGLLGVANLRVKHPFNRLFVEACVAAGIPRNDDFNGVTQEGVGYYQATQKGGLRCSTARSYLRPVRDHKNLRLLMRAFVSRIRVRAGVAEAVEFEHYGVSKVAVARREVLLAAGTIGSPKILMLSGIGSRRELDQHGITCINELAGVGRNLQDHPGIILSYDVNMRTMNVEVHSKWRFGLRALQFALMRRGPGTTPISHVGVFFRTRPELPAFDAQVHFQPLGYEVTAHKVILAEANRVSLAVNVSRPQARGAIRLRSSNPQDAPIIEHPLLESNADVRTLIDGARVMRGIFHSPQLREHVQKEYLPGEAVTTDEQWEAYVRAASFAMYHPVGTCRMGDVTDPNAVVDAELRVKNIARLRVIDASVMPSLPSCNTNGPTIMIAERAAEMLIGGAKRHPV